MAEIITLEATRRQVTGKAVRRLRAKGHIPAVLYGPSVSEPVPLQVEERALRIALTKAGGSNIIELHVNGEKYQVLVREAQRDVIKGNLLHVDFYAMAMDKPVRTEVPIHLVGEAPPVETSQSTMLFETSSVEVECLPRDLPDVIALDMSDVTDPEAVIYARDLKLPEGVTLISDPDEVIVRLERLYAEAEGEEEEEVAEAREADEVEVIRKRKAEEESEE